MIVNCLTNNVSDMNIENFETYLRQGNMAENTVAAYLYAVKEYYSRPWLSSAYCRHCRPCAQFSF